MNHLKKVIHNCKQATMLIEKRQIKKLSFRETVELRIHLIGCSMCRLYNKQSHIIHQMVLQLFHDTESRASALSLDDDFKKQLHDRIEEKLNNN